MAKRAILLPMIVAGALVLAAAPASPARQSGWRAFTVEPTLALTLDPAFDDVQRGQGGASGRLRLDVGAVDDVSDVELAFSAPDGLTLEGETTQRLAALRRGEARSIVVPFRSGRGGDQSVRVEATFRTSDGVTRTLGQGITLPATEPLPPGRRYLGAYECQAVPLSELHR